MSLMLALLLLSPLPAQEFDPDYTTQYNRYIETTQMTDPAAKATAFMDQFESGVDDRILEFVLGGIPVAIQETVTAGNYDAVYPRADRYGELYPDGLFTAQALALDAAARAGNSAMIAKYGEPVYAEMPNPQIALLLTQAFGQLNNETKMIRYARITIDSGAFPLPDIFNIAYAVLQYDVREGQTDGAVGLARKIRADVTGAPQGLSAGDWKTVQVFMLDLIGRNDFEAQRYREALASFDEILELSGRSDKAWFLKGNTMLQIGARPNDAALALAKAVVIDGNYAGQARSLLESIAASNAPPGASAVNQYIQEKLGQARRELGQ